MSELDKVQPQGLCPWNICAEAHYSHAKDARNAAICQCSHLISTS